MILFFTKEIYLSRFYFIVLVDQKPVLFLHQINVSCQITIHHDISVYLNKKWLYQKISGEFVTEIASNYMKIIFDRDFIKRLRDLNEYLYTKTVIHYYVERLDNII